MSRVTLVEGDAPSTPASGKIAVYTKAGGKVYVKDDVGTETVLNTDATEVAAAGAAMNSENLSGLASAATAFSNIKQSATTSATGVVELATDTEAIAGTSDSVVMTPGNDAAALAVAKNPLAFAQGVHLTAASSGSNGIQVPDDDNLDMGTGDFTLVWRGSLPDWTPDSNAFVLRKEDGSVGFAFGVQATTNYLYFYDRATVTRTSGVAIPIMPDGSVHFLAAAFTRETAGADGQIDFYFDGALLASIVVSAGSPNTFTNTDNFFVGGSSGVRIASVSHFAALFNRALTADEVLDLYRYGVDFADKDGSQTELVSNGDFSAWTGDDPDSFSFVGTETGTSYVTEHASGARIVSDGSLMGVYQSILTANKRYRCAITVDSISGSMDVASGASLGTSELTITAAGTYVVEFLAEASGATVGFKRTAGATLDAVVSSFSVTQIGTTLRLEPENIQPSPGQWLDASANKLHAMMPAAGASLTRPKNTFEFRSTNTWTASSAAQYIGGVNQNVLTDKHFITEIISQVTESTDVENIEIGDGSDADRFVAAVGPSGTTYHTLANRTNDGTNLQLKVTPAAEATMTIEFIVRGFLLES